MKRFIPNGCLSVSEKRHFLVNSLYVQCENCFVEKLFLTHRVPVIVLHNLPSVYLVSILLNIQVESYACALNAFEGECVDVIFLLV